MAFVTSLAKAASRVFINKYTAAAAAGALAISAGPTFVERGARGIITQGEAHEFAQTTYEDMKKLSLRDKVSYKPIR